MIIMGDIINTDQLRIDLYQDDCPVKEVRDSGMSREPVMLSDDDDEL